MKALLVLSLILVAGSTTTLAQNAPAPVIISITPDSGPASGGTAVAITGANLGLPPNFACFAPCPARVRFGSETVTVEQERDTLLVAVTPPHAAGVVDVTVLTGDGRTVTAANAFTYTSAAESVYERVLLPIYLEGSVKGGNGSEWITQLYLRNNGSQFVSIAPWPCNAEACLPVIPTTYSLGPGETLRSLAPFFRPPTANRSRLLHIQKSGVEEVSAHLRVADISRDTTDAGAEIPVIREGHLLRSTTRLHGVPLQDRYRTMLRIYDVAQTGSRFRVRVYEEGTAADAVPLREFEMTAQQTETGEFRSQAAYAEYAALFSLLDGPSIQPVAIRLEIEPLTSGSRYWAFVAITNNETQRVTLVTPQ